MWLFGSFKFFSMKTVEKQDVFHNLRLSDDFINNKANRYCVKVNIINMALVEEDI